MYNSELQKGFILGFKEGEEYTFCETIKMGMRAEFIKEEIIKEWYPAETFLKKELEELKVLLESK